MNGAKPHVHDGFVGVAADMGRAKQVGQAEKLHVRRRFAFIDIERGAGDDAVDQGLLEGLAVNYGPARGVDDERRRFHLGEGVAVDQMVGQIGQRRVDGDEIGLAVYLSLRYMKKKTRLLFVDDR